MKKKIILFVLTGILAFSGMTVSAAEEKENRKSAALSGILDQVKEQLDQAFENIDEETAKEIFSFAKEKVAEGNLNTEEGLSKAIEDGETEFGISVDRINAQKIVDAMEKLEDMGFSGEYIVGKAEELYDEYGADFSAHMDEVVTGAVKNAVSNAAEGFFQGIRESVRGFFGNLFSGFKTGFLANNI